MIRFDSIAMLSQTISDLRTLGRVVRARSRAGGEDLSRRPPSLDPIEL